MSDDLISRRDLLDRLGNLTVRNIRDQATLDLVEDLFAIFRRTIKAMPSVDLPLRSEDSER